MLMLKGKNEKSRIIEYIRMGMGSMVHNTVCFEYDEHPVIHNSFYMEKDKYSLSEFNRSIEMYLEDENPKYMFVYTNEQESDLSSLIELLDSLYGITVILTCQ
jgi:hypothetical protein